MNKIFGNSPYTTIAGLVVAGLMVAQEYIEKGVTSPARIAIAVAVVILGRFAKDDNKQ